LERIQDSQPLAISVDSLCLHTYSYVKLDIPFCTNLKGVCRPFQQDKHYIDKSSYYADVDIDSRPKHDRNKWTALET